MSFLGIGPGELLLIIILLLVVVGPERLPGMARTFGRGLVRVRNWMQTSPDAALVLRARQELEQELAEIRSSLLEVQSVRDEVLGVAKQLDEAVSPIANARTNLSDLIKPPVDAPLPRASNGQSVEPLAGEAQDAAAAAGVEPTSVATADNAGLLLSDVEDVHLAPADDAADLVLPSGVEIHATAPEAKPAAPSPDTLEELNLRIQTLAADIRAFQDHARSEAALRSAQIEAVMADMHELQKQLKQRGLLGEEWQPPSWTMSTPGEQHDVPEADR
jgi:Sec-independent protein translocase protein TatA